MRALSIALVLLTAGQSPPPAPSGEVGPAAAALHTRAVELIALLNGGGDPSAMFHPGFLAQIPETRLRTLSTQVTAGVGKAVRVAKIDAASPNAAVVTIACERGVITLQLALELAAPHRITELLITGAGIAKASIPAVIDTLKTLPGRTGFVVVDIDGPRPKLIQGHNPDLPLAIGSAFKLVILAELVRQIETGERRWNDTVTIDGRELPRGAFNQLPKGTTVPIRGLAEKMISVSDNSATDLLLFALGRDKVEAMQKNLGIADPARNRPFLSTMEAFKLKGIARLRERWLIGDERARRAMLAEVDAAPTTALATLFADGKPVAPDRIEWFLSPLDLARTMDWLRRHTESGPGAEARRILAINPGVGPAIGKGYNYIGYKGGSEPGVINMTLMVQRRDGGWRVLTGSWENPAAALDNPRFIALIGRATELTAAK